MSDEDNTVQLKEKRIKMLTPQSVETGMHESSAWWVLYTRHQHEKAVAEMLSAKGFEVFCRSMSRYGSGKTEASYLLCRYFPAMYSSEEDSIADCRS